MTHQELRDQVRPITGGLEIENKCTLGMIARYGSQDVFLTNTHCSQKAAELDDPTYIYDQPESGGLYPNSAIGIEIRDTGPINNRYSDAAIMGIDLGVDFAFGTIAATNGRTQTWGQAAPREILSSTPRYTIEGERQTLLQGTPVVKTGRTTGATIGYMENTCATIRWTPDLSGPTYDLKCQHTADPLYTLGGDSGSPVFTDYVVNGKVELLGILWGSFEVSGVRQPPAIFSPLTGIRQDLEQYQTTLVFYDTPIQVTLNGPTTIDQTGNYTWNTSVNFENGTVSYQWSIKYDGSSSWTNLGTSPSQSVYVSNDTDFDIKVVVTDANSSDTKTKIVFVNFGGCDPTLPC